MLFWCWRQVSNLLPPVLHTSALPLELHQHGKLTVGLEPTVHGLATHGSTVELRQHTRPEGSGRPSSAVGTPDLSIWAMGGPTRLAGLEPTTLAFVERRSSIELQTFIPLAGFEPATRCKRVSLTAELQRSSGSGRIRTLGTGPAYCCGITVNPSYESTPFDSSLSALRIQSQSHPIAVTYLL